MSMSEWRTCKLSEIGNIVGGATPSTKNPNFYDGEIPWITPKDLTNWSNMYISKGERSITKAGYDSASCKMMPKGSVLFTSRAPIGYIAIAANDVCTNQGFKSVVPNTDLIDSHFLYYSLIFNKNKIISMGSGTTFAEISGKVMASVEISLPPLDIQRNIASILSSLDDKIAVNKKICENLEAQAQALFKHWFVDFAPFKDGKFVESELGLIPEGWRVGTLGELGDIVGGATPSKAEDSYYTNKGIAWLTPKDLSNKLLKFTSRGEIDITQEGYNNCSAKLMPKGSVLFSSRAPIGYLTIAKNDICTNQGFKSVVPKYAGTAYIYYLLKTNTKRIESMSSGTTFKEASGSLMKSLAVIIPPKNIIDNYEASVVDIFNEQEVIEEESSRLASLRDTLLPKLMSGQIKL